MSARSHYEILGVSRTASQQDIRAAYRRLVKQMHPDAGGNSAVFGMVTEAFEVLSDPERRRRYDAGQEDTSFAQSRPKDPTADSRAPNHRGSDGGDRAWPTPPSRPSARQAGSATARPLRGIARVRRPLLALVVLVVALVIGYVVKGAQDDTSPTSGPTTAHSSSSHSSSSATRSGLQVVPISQLPKQVGQTIELIEAGGPYPYPRNDGVVFHNNERVLPSEPDGYYHEFTVPTPGSGDRGPRRIVTGGDLDNPTFYYTGDHYETFVIVRVGGG